MRQKRRSKTIICHFCLDIYINVSKAWCMKCRKWLALFCNKDKVVTLVTKLGKPTLQRFFQHHSGVILELQLMWVLSPSVQTWHSDISHLTLKVMYYVFEAPSINFWYASLLRIDSSLYDIIGVWFLTKEDAHITHLSQWVGKIWFSIMGKICQNTWSQRKWRGILLLFLVLIW